MKVTTSYVVPPEYRDTIQKLAKKEHISSSQYICRLMDKHFRQLKIKPNSKN